MLYWDIDFRGMVFAPGGAGQSALAVGLAFFKLVLALVARGKSLFH